MKKIIFLFSISLIIIVAAKAQNVGIGTSSPNANAILDINSSNKGLLLPRLADTNAISGAKPAGLMMYSNADNQIYFYNGSNWQKSAAQTATDLWYVKNDSITYTNSQYVGINSNLNQIQPQANLQVNGSILAQQNTTQSIAAPSVAQTATMNNTATMESIGTPTDSVYRFFDPGGSNINYTNNMQGNIVMGSGNFGYQLSFNAADFGLGIGDTLWISNRSSFTLARNDYVYLFTNITTAPSERLIFSNAFFYIYFRSNADGNINKGFDITLRKIYIVPTAYPLVGSVSKAFYFNPSNGALRSGFITSGDVGDYSTAIGHGTNASGYSSNATGFDTNASGSSSTAMGAGTTASGSMSTSSGINTLATGNSSTAMGNSTTASGDISTAMGRVTVSNAYASVSIGQFNDSFTSSNKTAWVATDPLLILGNGTFAVRNNALVVYKNGNTDISGFTQLGKASEAAPKIKMKKIIIPSGPAVDANANYSFGGGITDNKVIGLQVLMQYSGATSKIPPGYRDASGYEYNIQVQFNGVTIINKVGNSANIGGKPITIVITYEE